MVVVTGLVSILGWAFALFWLWVFISLMFGITRAWPWR